MPRRRRLWPCALLASVSVLAGCSGGLPGYAPFVASLPVPALTGSCAGTGPDSGAVRVRVLEQSKLTSEVFAPVCVDGRGPFPFLVDTGSTLTIIDVGLARRLGLGPPAADAMAPCSRARYEARVGSMSIGTVAVGPTEVEIGGLATRAFPLVGIVGADALSRFAALRLDYRSRTLTFAAPGKPVPAGLTSGTRSAVQLRSYPSGRPLSAAGGPAGPVEVAATVGAVGTSLLLDTGAQGTLLTPTVTASAGLQRLRFTSEAYAGVGCTFRLSYFDAHTWRVGTVTMAAQPVASLGGFLVAGGSLGSGTLQARTPVVIDYRDGKLFLGP
jgi:predicted aspartyl protease